MFLDTRFEEKKESELKLVCSWIFFGFNFDLLVSYINFHALIVYRNVQYTNPENILQKIHFYNVKKGTGDQLQG